jgi:hypothetical protein
MFRISSGPITYAAFEAWKAVSAIGGGEVGGGSGGKDVHPAKTSKISKHLRRRIDTMSPLITAVSPFPEALPDLIMLIGNWHGYSDGL